MKILNILITIMEYIAATTLYIIVFGVGTHLVETKIIEFKWEWVKYFYYLGLGILSGYPCNNYIIGHNRRNK